ncbi:alpha/beta fold hydrolase [Synechococcus elongatus]|uniref:alpha/beta fold hydrolase n=1 Tax=Synechococcus elongatus TaxID=32046 RepID=UPI000F7E3BF3|nr:alpha/beta hydrolase [Synechococcus elongatus]
MIAIASPQGGSLQAEWTLAGDRQAPILYLHGWGGSRRNWQPMAQALEDCGAGLALDWRGFGEARSQPAGQDYSLQATVADVVALLDQLALSPVRIVAHSWGCSIALLFAQAYPDRCDRLLLTASGLFTYSPIAFAIFQQISQLLVRSRSPLWQQIPGLDRLILSRFCHRPLDPATTRSFLADFLQADTEAAIGSLQDAVSANAIEQLGQAWRSIAVPTLLISGQFDQIAPVALAEQAATLSDRCRQVVIPQVGHLPMLEDPTTFAAIARPFLQAPRSSLP